MFAMVFYYHKTISINCLHKKYNCKFKHAPHTDFNIKPTTVTSETTLKTRDQWKYV